MRYAVIVVVVLCAVCVQAFPQQKSANSPTTSQRAASKENSSARKIPCKMPENAAMCYWTRGRLNFANGNPSYRMWKVGTHRILAILSGPHSWEIDPLDNEHPEFPASLDRVFAAESKPDATFKEPSYLIGPVFGDFEVCPLEPGEPGRMQAVCIESAKNMFVPDSKRSYK